MMSDENDHDTGARVMHTGLGWQDSSEVSQLLQSEPQLEQNVSDPVLLAEAVVVGPEVAVGTDFD